MMLESEPGLREQHQYPSGFNLATDARRKTDGVLGKRREVWQEEVVTGRALRGTLRKPDILPFLTEHLRIIRPSTAGDNVLLVLLKGHLGKHGNLIHYIYLLFTGILWIYFGL